MNKKRIHRSNADKRMSFDLPSSVQQQDRKTFAFRIDLRFRLHLIVLLLNSDFAPLLDGRDHLR
jgi:hypothetical protein